MTRTSRIQRTRKLRFYHRLRNCIIAAVILGWFGLIHRQGPLPDQVAGLKAEPTYAAMKLHWDQADKADGYYVYASDGGELEKIATIEGYEALRNLPTELIEIETPLEVTNQPILAGKKLCFVPILRAGTGMLEGMLDLVPSARVGHIGLYRDEVTHQPVEYFCKLPNRLENREVFILDPMLATGGSALDSVKLLKQHGANKMCFIAIYGTRRSINKCLYAFLSGSLHHVQCTLNIICAVK